MNEVKEQSGLISDVNLGPPHACAPIYASTHANIHIHTCTPHKINREKQKKVLIKKKLVLHSDILFMQT